MEEHLGRGYKNSGAPVNLVTSGIHGYLNYVQSELGILKIQNSKRTSLARTPCEMHLMVKLLGHSTVTSITLFGKLPHWIAH